ncbi:hypothetical protein ACOSQ3_000851 [Xanthoceras sorbifolium]
MLFRFLLLPHSTTSPLSCPPPVAARLSLLAKLTSTSAFPQPILARSTSLLIRATTSTASRFRFSFFNTVGYALEYLAHAAGFSPSNLRDHKTRSLNSARSRHFHFLNMDSR